MANAFQVRVIRDPFPDLEGLAWIEARGPVNEDHIEEFQAAIEPLLTEGYIWLHFDLSEATYLMDTAWGALVRCSDVVQRAGGEVILIGLGGKSRMFVEMMGLGGFFTILPEVSKGS